MATGPTVRLAGASFAALLAIVIAAPYASAAETPVTERSSVKSQPTRPATTPDDLFRAIAAQDAALFDAYNHCELDKFASFFADDVEFYHDKGGVTRGSKALTRSVKENICGKTTRELVPGSLEVYPMDNYGALEIGIHRFHHLEGEKTEPVGEGKFVHLWQYDKQHGTWKITRVFSFDHHAVN